MNENWNEINLNQHSRLLQVSNFNSTSFFQKQPQPKSCLPLETPRNLLAMTSLSGIKNVIKHTAQISLFIPGVLLFREQKSVLRIFPFLLCVSLQNTVWKAPFNPHEFFIIRFRFFVHHIASLCFLHLI